MSWTVEKRPTLLSDMYGCDNVKTYFYNRVKDKKDFPTATMLSGQYGGGKTTTAKIIAKMMTCKNTTETGDPCNECIDCIAVDKETWSRDVMMIDGGSSGKADLIDRIQEFTMSPPIRGKRKVTIVEEVQELSTAAKNSLLKALETPRKNIHYIFLTMDNPTASGFLSRCTPFKFKFVPVVDLMKYMAVILMEEKLWKELPQEFKTEGLLTLAQNAQGSIRQSLQFLELCVDLKCYTKKDIEEQTGMYSESSFMEILQKILNGENSEQLFEAVMNPTDYNATFNLMLKVVSDAISYRTFGMVPGDNAYFLGQARQLAEHKNFELVKNTLIDLQRTSNSFLKKAVYMCTIADLVFKCRGVVPSGVTHIVETAPVVSAPLPTRTLPVRK